MTKFDKLKKLFFSNYPINFSQMLKSCKRDGRYFTNNSLYGLGEKLDKIKDK